ncbi:MAG: hypothetical protein ACK2U0_18585 [Candidatus Promineifilaceae bacterium]
MSKNDDFKDLANRAYMAYHQDGIIDMMLGAGVTGFGLRMFFDSPALIVLSWMPFLFYLPLKTHITAPRFGYVRFTGEEEERMKNTRLILLGLLVFIFVLGLVLALVYGRIAPQMQAFISQNGILLLGGLAALLLAVAAAVTGLRRFYLYAVLTLLFNIAGVLLAVNEGLMTVLLGLTIFAVGAWLLSRFLRAYPLPEEEDGRGR